MKKVLFIAVAAIATLAFSSCKDTKCTCTEEHTGVSQDFDLTGQNVYDNCDEIEDLFESAAGLDQEWKCK